MTPSRNCTMGEADFCTLCLETLLKDVKKLSLDQICCGYIIDKVDIIENSIIRVTHKEQSHYVRPVLEGKPAFEVYYIQPKPLRFNHR